MFKQDKALSLIRSGFLYWTDCCSTSATETKRGRRRTRLLVLCLGFLWYMSATKTRKRQRHKTNNLYNSPTQTWSWVHGFIYFGEEPSSGVRAQTCRRDSGSLLSDLYLTCFTLEVLIEDLSLQVKPRRLSLELDVIPVLDLSRLCTWLCDFLVLWLDSGLTCSLESCDWFLDLS